MRSNSGRGMRDERPRRGIDRAQLKTASAKRLRTTMTDCERKLWHALRAKRFAPVRFRRQQPIGPFIADFYCAAVKLVIELDGSQHGTQEGIGYDAARTAWLDARGYRVLRFSNIDVIDNMEGVMEGIWRMLEYPKRPLPEPPAAVRPSLKGRVG